MTFRHTFVCGAQEVPKRISVRSSTTLTLHTLVLDETAYSVASMIVISTSIWSDAAFPRHPLCTGAALPTPPFGVARTAVRGPAEVLAATASASQAVVTCTVFIRTALRSCRVLHRSRRRCLRSDAAFPRHPLCTGAALATPPFGVARTAVRGPAEVLAATAMASQ